MASNKGVMIGTVVVVIIIIGVVVFALIGNDSSDSTRKDITNSLWYNIELTDINSGETFRISDFRDKPVLFESFAVWCPTCTKQQEETKKFEEQFGDLSISISIDTDPNENVAKVLEHTQSHGFNWRYAVSTEEMTQSLIDDFGVGIIQAPSVPMVLVCEDGTAKKLSGGVKKVAELKEAVASCSS